MDTKTIAIAVGAIVVVAAAIYFLLPMPITLACSARQAGLNQQIEQLNYCSATEDCEAQALFCPFNCWVYVNRNADFASLKAQIDAYGNECEACTFSCSESPAATECIQGKCVSS